MKISLDWLCDYVKLDLSVQEIADLLTDIGLEVEKIDFHEHVKGNLEGVVIGKVIKCEKHPNADRLNVTQVDIGEKDYLSIVCGAPNVRKGLIVPVATVGTRLYSDKDSFKIKRSKIRGEVSEGMICGPDEIGLGDDTGGVMELENDSVVGQNASEYFQLKKDVVFEIGLTPNRSDAMCHVGVARDIQAAINFRKGLNNQICKPSVDKFSVGKIDDKFSVKVVRKDLCDRYSGVTISGVKVSSSPKWLRQRLASIGIESINNIVDVTNYVLHELGQPLHAFDLSKVNDHEIMVNTVSKNTLFTTLDSVDRQISEDDLMICDSKRPLCVAGVYGGLDSGVSSKTSEIFLESAVFDSVSIRKTSKRHSLSTDASFRFERGCDPDITVYALKRASLLIQEIAGGRISSNIVDIYNTSVKSVEILLNYSTIYNVIGQKIDKNIVKSILKDLEIVILEETNKALSLRVPKFRVDVTREVDVVEEILRIYGYNNLKSKNYFHIPFINYNTSFYGNSQNKISTLLANNGFSEIMNNSITRSKNNNCIKDLDDSHNIHIINPLSSELDVMRRTLIYGILESISYNYNRQLSRIRFFEFGKIYSYSDNRILEKNRLSLAISGKLDLEGWNRFDKDSDYFDLKENVELVLSILGIEDYISKDFNGLGVSYGTKYQKDGNNLVYFGQLKDDILKSFDIKKSVFYAEFDWDKILEISAMDHVVYQEISKFPSVRRDLSLLIDNKISYNQLKDLALNLDIKILKSINLFDEYSGKGVPDGHKSYSLSFTFSDKKKTLTDKYIDQIMKRLIDEYIEIGAEIR
ncbi:MAG: phenylalanine--tRNA ligase subunit beta [Flavobacteriales bacterium]|nr:phenylalanine--tRNA ligase subunit beta [Flavobacteriales bacterium]